MPLKEKHINPCFCISLRAGAIVLSVHDLIYGTAYIFRVMYIEYLQNHFYEYFPDPFPNPTKSRFMFYMSRRGNYHTTLLLGLIMLLAVIYLRYYYFWLAATCYFWLIVKTFLVISYSIFCNALLESDRAHFKRFGYEMLFNIFMNVYFMMVIACFVRETRIELNNYRAIKPINIERDEHEEYLMNDRISKFNDATSYYFLSPDYFLNSQRNVKCEERYMRYNNLEDTHLDDTLLQYVVSSSKVMVLSENEAEEMMTDEEKSKRDILTIKMMDTEMAMKEAESESVLPSEMSIPPDWDRESGMDGENGSLNGRELQDFSRSEGIMISGVNSEVVEAASGSIQDKEEEIVGAEVAVSKLEAPSSTSTVKSIKK